MTTQPTQAQNLKVGDRILHRRTDIIVTVVAVELGGGLVRATLRGEGGNYPMTPCKPSATVRRVVAEPEPEPMLGTSLKTVCAGGGT